MIAIEERAGGALVALTFSHPKGNILTDAMVREWRAHLAQLAAPERAKHVRLLTIEGAGVDFSFGANIVEHAPDRIAEALPEMNAFILDLLRLPMPTAAVVRGRCLGGGFEVALSCDFIIAERDASFGLPEIAIGAFAPIASVLLPARVGLARAMPLLLTGRTQTAAELAHTGLVHVLAEPEGSVLHDSTEPEGLVLHHMERRVFRPGDFLTSRVDRWFEDTFGRWSAEALRHAIRAARADIVAAAERRLPDTEREYLESLAHTHDAREGVQAFLEKRAAVWKDE